MGSGIKSSLKVCLVPVTSSSKCASLRRDKTRGARVQGLAGMCSLTMLSGRSCKPQNAALGHEHSGLPNPGGFRAGVVLHSLGNAGVKLEASLEREAPSAVSAALREAFHLL